MSDFAKRARSAAGRIVDAGRDNGVQMTMMSDLSKLAAGLSPNAGSIVLRALDASREDMQAGNRFVQQLAATADQSGRTTSLGPRVQVRAHVSASGPNGPA